MISAFSINGIRIFIDISIVDMIQGREMNFTAMKSVGLLKAQNKVWSQQNRNLCSAKQHLKISTAQKMESEKSTGIKTLSNAVKHI